MTELLAAAPTEASVWQYVIIGLVTGSLYALIAIGYTMVYGIIELINFAHGDLFMLGSFLAVTHFTTVGLKSDDAVAAASVPALAGLILLALVLSAGFCATLNVAVDRFVYRPVRNAPKLTAIVSAIGVSFVFMNAGVLWHGPTDVNFPNLVDPPKVDADGEVIPPKNLTGNPRVQFTYRDLLVVAVTVPAMVALTWFVRYTTLGKAMRGTAQNPTAARLMGINVDRVIAATFAIGGALAGVAAVVYGLYNGTVGYQMGFQNGVYAFTAAVLGGVGNIPGAVLGGLLIGLVKSLGTLYVGETWNEALVFAILIVILIFRPTGLLGARTREKV